MAGSINSDSAFPDPEAMCGCVEDIINVGHQAWRQGIMAGFSGNISCRLPSGNILLTASGSAKGRLFPADILRISPDGSIMSAEHVQLGGTCSADSRIARTIKPSSEIGLHLAIYAAIPTCMAILHSHPPYLQALELKLAREKIFGDKFLKIDLYEAVYWNRRLAIVPAIPPGSSELGPACVAALENLWPEVPPFPAGAWLRGHGLCAIGEDVFQCLAYSEELEHIARVQLLAE